MKHTPTPWTTLFDGDEVQIGDSSGNFVAMTLPCESSGATERDYANAAHIVKCVNAHDELVAALKTMVEDAWYAGPTHEGLEQAKNLLNKLEGVTE
jgi:hypothetical protein